MALLGAIDISMAANTAKLAAGLKSARTQLSGFGASALASGKAFGSFTRTLAGGESYKQLSSGLLLAGVSVKQFGSGLSATAQGVKGFSMGLAATGRAARLLTNGFSVTGLKELGSGLITTTSGVAKFGKGLVASGSSFGKFAGGLSLAGASAVSFTSKLGFGAVKRFSAGLTSLAGMFSGLVGGFASITQGALNFGLSLASISVKGLLVGLAGVGAGAVGLVKLASDAEETSNKFKEVFGEMSDDAFAWSDSFAATVQRSKFGVRTMMADMQDLLKPMGFDTKAAAMMSKQVTQLAVDLASFGNLKDDEALLKLRSGLSGEAEPLKSMGINANETAVNLKLMEMGLKGGTKAASEQQKVLARLAIITEATQKKNALGDAARTAGSVANSFKGLTGRIIDLGTEIGQSLLPVAAEVISTFKGWIPSADGIKAAFASMDLVGMFKNLREWLVEAAAGFYLMGQRIMSMVGGTTNLSGGFSTLKEIVSAVMDVVTNFDLTWEMLGLSALKAIKQITAPIVNLASNLKSFMGWLIDSWKTSWQGMAEIVLGVLENIGKNVRGLFSEVWQAIKSGFSHEIDTSQFTRALTEGIRTAIEKPRFKTLVEVDTKHEDMRLGQLGDEFNKRKAEQLKLANDFKAKLSEPIKTQTPDFKDATKEIDIKSLAGESKLKQDADKLREDLKTPLEKFHEELVNLKKLNGNGLISKAELDKGEQKLREKYKLSDFQGFAGALQFGSTEARSAILRNRFGGNKGIDAVAESTKQTAAFHRWQRQYVLRQTAALESKQTVTI